MILVRSGIPKVSRIKAPSFERLSISNGAAEQWRFFDPITSKPKAILVDGNAAKKSLQTAHLPENSP
jgi:hypothetical protein